jgi:putative ABC transport system permease protein
MTVQSSKLIRNIKLGVKSLMLHKLRSLLTMLGVVFGVAAVVAMLAVGEGASREALTQLRKLGSNNIILHSAKALEDQSSGTERKRMNMYGLKYEDEPRLKRTFDSIIRTVPVKEVRKEASLGDISREVLVVGTTPDWFDLVVRPVLAGRLLNGEDMRGSTDAVVLTESGARELLATHHTIGQSIRIGSHFFTVVGIVQNEKASGNAQIPDSEIDAYIPIHIAKERYGDHVVERSAGAYIREQIELQRIIVEVDQTENVEQTAVGIQRMLEHFHPSGDFDMYVPLALLRQAEAQQRIWNWTLGSVAGISLLVGGIGIMNIMLASVTERTREIGVRRAIGAKRRQIIGQFLIETVVLSAAGGFIGVIVGPALAQIITLFSKMPTIVPLYSIILSVGISMAIGIIFGLYPAVRAANLDPIVALRHE